MAYTPVTVALLAQLRAEQGRKLHQARHLWLVPTPPERTVIGETRGTPT